MGFPLHSAVWGLFQCYSFLKPDSSLGLRFNLPFWLLYRRHPVLRNRAGNHRRELAPVFLDLRF